MFFENIIKFEYLCKKLIKNVLAHNILFLPYFENYLFRVPIWGDFRSLKLLDKTFWPVFLLKKFHRQKNIISNILATSLHSALKISDSNDMILNSMFFCRA